MHRALLNSCLLKYFSFKEFHKKVKDLFIPTKRQNILAQDLLYQPQGRKRKLDLFVKDIIEASQILLINKMETDKVNVIIGGLSPKVRNWLVFMDHPKNFRDVDHLCACINSTIITDNPRASLYCNPKSRQHSFRPRSEVTCFCFRQSGHMNPQCCNQPSGGFAILNFFFLNSQQGKKISQDF